MKHELAVLFFFNKFLFKLLDNYGEPNIKKYKFIVGANIYNYGDLLALNEVAQTLFLSKIIKVDISSANLTIFNLEYTRIDQLNLGKQKLSIDLKLEKSEKKEFKILRELITSFS